MIIFQFEIFLKLRASHNYLFNLYLTLYFSLLSELCKRLEGRLLLWKALNYFCATTKCSDFCKKNLPTLLYSFPSKSTYYSTSCGYFISLTNISLCLEWLKIKFYILRYIKIAINTEKNKVCFHFQTFGVDIILYTKKGKHFVYIKTFLKIT